MTQSTMLRWLMAAVGLALAVAAVIGVALGWSTGGIGVLLGFAAALLLLAAAADRVTGVRVGKYFSAELKVDITGTGLPGAAATYSFIHNQLAGDTRSTELKIQLQDQVVTMVKENAFRQPIDPDQAAAAIKSGSPAERVLAFGWLQAVPTAATLPLLVQGIEESLSGNEQYHASLAAEARAPALSPAEVEQLVAAIRRAPHISEDSDRHEVAERIVARYGSTSPAKDVG